LSGLDPEKHYRLEEINGDGTNVFSSRLGTGKDLMATGINISWPNDARSVVILLQ